MDRIIHQAIPDLDAAVKKVIVYYIDITSEDEIRKFTKEDDSTTLDDVVIGDYAEFHVKKTHDNLYSGWAVLVDKCLSDRVMQKIFEFNGKDRMNVTAKKPFKPTEISEEGLELIEYLSVDCTANKGEWHSDSEVKIDKLEYVVHNRTKTKEFWDGTFRNDKRPLRLKVRNICGDETEWEVY